MKKASHKRGSERGSKKGKTSTKALARPKNTLSKSPKKFRKNSQRNNFKNKRKDKLTQITPQFSAVENHRVTRKNLSEMHLRDQVWVKTGWGKVATWYENTISAEKSMQKDVILPALFQFFPGKGVLGKSIIDLGCGTGLFLKEYLAFGAERSLGVDIDEELLDVAKINMEEELENKKVYFLQTDASNLSMIGNESFDVVLSVESLPNISDLKAFAKTAERILSKEGRLIAVINHPAFRVPQSSDWHYDKEHDRQGRVVYKYKSEHTIKIDMNPGNKNPKNKIYTYTFHRSLEEYLNTFVNAGLTFSKMKEVYSNKVSFGPRKLAEDLARSEIPMFLFLEFIK